MSSNKKPKKIIPWTRLRAAIRRRSPTQNRQMDATIISALPRLTGSGRPVAVDLRKLLVEQFIGGHAGGSLNFGEVLGRDSLTTQPLRDAPLTHPDSGGQFLLRPGNLDRPLQCTHEVTLVPLIWQVNSAAHGGVPRLPISVTDMAGKDQSRKAKPTPADQLAAEKLRRLWNEFQRANPGVTQEDAADKMGFTQGALSQYLKGSLPIRARAVLRFSQYLGCEPRDIRDDLPELRSAKRPLDPVAEQLWALWPRLDKHTKQFFLETARSKVQAESAAQLDSQMTPMRRKLSSG